MCLSEVSRLAGLDGFSVLSAAPRTRLGGIRGARCVESVNLDIIVRSRTRGPRTEQYPGFSGTAVMRMHRSKSCPDSFVGICPSFPLEG